MKKHIVRLLTGGATLVIVFGLVYAISWILYSNPRILDYLAKFTIVGLIALACYIIGLEFLG